MIGLIISLRLTDAVLISDAPAWKTHVSLLIVVFPRLSCRVSHQLPGCNIARPLTSLLPPSC